MVSNERPESVFDQGLQHERTALAWERTAIAMMVAGVLFARYASESLHLVFALAGLAQVVIGGFVLVWSARHYEDLHGPLREGLSPVHPTAAVVVGVSTIVFSALATILALVIALG